MKLKIVSMVLVLMMLSVIFATQFAAVLAAETATERELRPDANTVLLDHFDGAALGTVYGPLTYVTSIPGLGQAADLVTGTYVRYDLPTWYSYGSPAEARQGTVELWINPKEYPAFILYFQWQITTGPPSSGFIVWLYINPEGKLEYWVWNGAGDGGLTGATTIPLNEWTHVAVTWGPAGTKQYINGLVDASSTVNYYPAMLSYVYVYLNSWGEPGLGQKYVDELHISKVQRTDAEIYDHYTRALPLPDVAIVSVTKSASKVISGDTVTINVTAQNLGTPFENFTVTAYYDDTPIGSFPVTDLAPAATTNLTFSWNTIGVPLGTYTIKANATTVQGETNIANNQVTNGTVWIVQYPIASFTYSPIPPVENSSTTFDASSSDPRGGSIVNYTWTFDDGNVTTTTTPVITHVYALKGTYNVGLTIWDSEDLSNSTSQPVTVLRHDLAIIDVTPNRNWVYQGWSANINVTVKNNGDFDETVVVTLYYNMTGGGIVGTQTVSLLVGQNKTITFTWNTTGIQCCRNYTMTAVASIPGDTVPADNNLADGDIRVRMMFDANGDDKINMEDISAVSKAFGTMQGITGWNPDLDFNQDGKIDVKDLVGVARHFGFTCTP